MIDFRYHIVSIVAVFLALAVGVGLGSTALRGPVVNDLGNNVDRLTKENKGLRSNVSSLRTQNKQQQQFAAEAAPRLLKDTLTGQQVSVVSLPGASSGDRGNLIKTLGQAGASVVSQVELTSSFTDPASEAKIADLSVRDLDLVPGLQLPSGNNGVQQGAALLGAMLVGANGVTVSADARSSVLSSLATLGVVKVDGNVTQPAGAMILVGGAAATGDNATAKNSNALAVVSQLSASTGRMVVAGPGGANGIIASVRGSSSLTKVISTVDDIEQPTGQVAAALALAAEVAGRSGQYGTASGASALMPSAS